MTIPHTPSILPQEATFMPSSLGLSSIQGARRTCIGQATPQLALGFLALLCSLQSLKSRDSPPPLPGPMLGKGSKIVTGAPGQQTTLRSTPYTLYLMHISAGKVCTAFVGLAFPSSRARLPTCLPGPEDQT
mmetsp:Transcript_38251/g.68283  ORF Transcript_38251/g.68283 Transcript_38251/m.68283 type:complete len:131 (-) Transcript_38251:543-935(-)